MTISGSAMINLNDPESLTFLGVAELLAFVPDDGTAHQIRVRESGEVVILSEPDVANLNFAGFAVFFETITAKGYVGPIAASNFEYIAEIYQSLKDNWPVNEVTYVDHRNASVLYPVRSWSGVELMDPSFTPDLIDVSGDEAIEEIMSWFRENFEDPVHTTSIDGGEYVYIWGGPFDAGEVITDAFSGEVSEEVLEAAKNELERESLLWVPHQDRLYSEDEWSFPDNLIKNQLDSQTVSKVLDTIEVARSYIQALKPAHGSIGHNLPPDELPASPVPSFELDGLEQALDEIEIAVEKPTGLPSKLGQALRRISMFVGEAGQWLASTVDNFVQEAAKAAGKSVGFALGALLISYANWDALTATLERLLSLFF